MVTKYTDYAGRPRNLKIETVTIVEGSAESSTLDSEFFAIYGLLVPVLDSCNMTLKVSETPGGAYKTVKAQDGTNEQVALGTGDCAVSSEALTVAAGYRYIRVALSVVQSAERVFTWILKS